MSTSTTHCVRCGTPIDSDSVTCPSCGKNPHPGSVAAPQVTVEPKGAGNGFLFLAGLIGIVGVFNLTEATQGVGLLAVALIFTVVARMQQAHDHLVTTRRDPSPLVEGPSGVAFGLLVLLLLAALGLGLVAPIIEDARELERARDASERR